MCSYAETHLPEHMRFNKVARFIRFLFMPISLMGLILQLNTVPELGEIQDTCQIRNTCYSHCTNDNFPYLMCEFQEFALTYNQNEYTQFFKYPNPHKTHNTEDTEGGLMHTFEFCEEQIERNSQFPYSEIEPERQWRVHTCFKGCRKEGEVDPAITLDERPICDDDQNREHDSILCLTPETECEIFVKNT